MQSMPPLAGRDLQAPSFHQTGWKVGQRFIERDDPDRTQQPWKPPLSIVEKDPALQVEKTTLEGLVLPQCAKFRTRVAGEWKKSDRSFAHVMNSVLDEEDCAALLDQINAKGFTPALINIGGGRQQLIQEVRDGHRVIVDSPELAAWLFEVLRPQLPPELPDGSKLSGLNERLRFLCYTPGQIFEEHKDGQYVRPPGHPQAGERSHITVQLYLHDVPANHGGATTFFPSSKDPVRYQPKVGSVLMFTQDLPHEGSLVEQGIKYTLRTEVMYSPPQYNHAKTSIG